MSLLPAVMVLAGLPLGFWMRGLAIRHSVAEGQPLRSVCPRCETLLPGAAGRAGAPGPLGAAGLSRAAGREGTAIPDRLASFAALAAGRCPECRIRVGPPPLVAEVVTAAALAALALRRPAPTGTGIASAGPWPDAAPTAELLAYGWLAVVAVALFLVDIAVHRLPDRLTATAYLGTTALITVTALLTGRYGDLLRACLGGLALAAFYLLLFVVNPSGMGLGDVKLAASLGTALGWLGWSTLVTGAFLGFLAGGLYGGALLATRRAGRGSEIPFGPFMIVGAFAAILAGL